MHQFRVPIFVGQYEGEQGNEVDGTVEGKHITESGYPAAMFAVLCRSGIDLQNVFDEEYQRCDIGDGIKQAVIG